MTSEGVAGLSHLRLWKQVHRDRVARLSAAWRGRLAGKTVAGSVVRTVVLHPAPPSGAVSWMGISSFPKEQRNDRPHPWTILREVHHPRRPGFSVSLPALQPEAGAAEMVLGSVLPAPRVTLFLNTRSLIQAPGWQEPEGNRLVLPGHCVLHTHPHSVLELAINFPDGMML